MEVLGSHLAWETAYSDWSFPGIPQSLQENDSTTIRPARFLPNGFQFVIRQFFYFLRCMIWGIYKRGKVIPVTGPEGP
jgi:hypothetical protein